MRTEDAAEPDVAGQRKGEDESSGSRRDLVLTEKLERDRSRKPDSTPSADRRQASVLMGHVENEKRDTEPWASHRQLADVPSPRMTKLDSEAPLSRSRSSGISLVRTKTIKSNLGTPRRPDALPPGYKATSQVSTPPTSPGRSLTSSPMGHGRTRSASPGFGTPTRSTMNPAAPASPVSQIRSSSIDHARTKISTPSPATPRRQARAAPRPESRERVRSAHRRGPLRLE